MNFKICSKARKNAKCKSHCWEESKIKQESMDDDGYCYDSSAWKIVHCRNCGMSYLEVDSPCMSGKFKLEQIKEKKGIDEKENDKGHGSANKRSRGTKGNL